MRLFEMEDHFASDLITLLRNQLGRGDSEDTSLVLTYPALSNMMQIVLLRFMMIIQTYKKSLKVITMKKLS